MKLLANLSFRTSPTIKNLTQLFFYKRFLIKACQIYDLLSFSAFFRAVQVLNSRVLATMLADHVSRNRI